MVSELIAELKKVIDNKKRKKLIFMLMVILKFKKQSKIIDFYNIMGELLHSNYDFVLNKCYFHLKKKAGKILTPDELFEMDKYILENFCFGEVEKLLTSFKGLFSRPKSKVNGYIYLTNFRFLAHGKIKEKKISSGPMTGPKRIYELPFYIAAQAIRESRKAQMSALKKSLQQAMGPSFTETALHIFPSHFPINDAYNIKVSKNSTSFKYTIKLKYPYKKSFKTTEVEFKITPIQEGNENSSEFNMRRDQIYASMEEILGKNQ